MTLGQCLGGRGYTTCHVTELGRRFPNVGIDGCKLRLDRRRPNVDTNGRYTLVGQPVANEQKDVGPTLAANVGPTQLRTLGQRTTNGCLLSVVEIGVYTIMCIRVVCVLINCTQNKMEHKEKGIFKGDENMVTTDHI